jgi:hypothetical protein
MGRGKWVEVWVLLKLELKSLILEKKKHDPVLGRGRELMFRDFGLSFDANECGAWV